MRNNKGFTLVELLAVIVILGLLMAIAIPSVTKYITQSRVKTLISTMDSYITAVVTQVNDGEYKFSDSTKIYAIPIECVALEKGGTNPFGNWYQANENYWAYVLVHYDNENYNYQYGFTFKDDAGYGLYPTLNGLITNSMVRTGYDDLKQPKDGLAKDFVPIDKWEGFDNITADTELIVLESASKGETGDGKDTCTLCQKGDNYDEVEQEKENKNKLSYMIKKHNTLITANPTLTTSSNESGDENGLYSSTLTNDGQATFYFRGNVTNNYVKFAGLTWRIVRINESGTIRLILADTINNTTYKFNSLNNNYQQMYYSNSDIAKPTVDNWYNINIVNKGYDSYVAKEMFCEQARVKIYSNYESEKAYMKILMSYAPTFKCANDGNGYGILNIKVGLLSFEEAIFAGGYERKGSHSYYLNSSGFWTMSPAGVITNQYPAIQCVEWYVPNTDRTYNYALIGSQGIRPVINLNADVLATGTGTSSDPYVVQTN